MIESPPDIPVSLRSSLNIRKYWKITLLTTLIMLFCIGIAYYSTAILMDSIIHRSTFTVSEVGGAVGACFAAVCFASPSVGWLISKVGARLVLILGGAIVALSVLYVSRASSLASIYLGFVGLGIGAAAGGYIAVFVIIVAHTGESSAFIMGVAATGAAIGGVVAAPTLSSAVASFGYQNALAGMAIVAILGISALAIGLPPVKNAGRPTGENLSNAYEGKSHLSNWRYWSFALGTGILFGVSGVVELQLVATASERNLGSGVTAFTAAVSVSVLVRFLTPLTLNIWPGRTVLLGMLTMQLISLTLIFVTPWWFGYLIGAALIGLCVGGSNVLAPILLADIFGKRQFRTLLSATFFVAGIVALFVPTVMGMLHNLTGDYSISTIWLYMLTLLSLAAYVAAMRTRQSKITDDPGAVTVTA
ncbi:nitrate/nitrite transporter [Rhodococcus koreensis]|uniref:MFS transporter n=1 Tax=Rhodococcus koreensis TaxID=99653 RepID=UPI00367325CD